MRSTKQKKKSKKWLWISLSVIGILVLAVGGYVFYLFKSATDTVANINETTKPGVTTPVNDMKSKQPLAILLMGVDERQGDAGRSDSLIYITVNPNKKTMEMVSIPRDTRTEIVGRGTQDKINHAYAFGGTEMAINTVKHFLNGLPVNYFVKVNMESFKDIVDAVGGVEVNNDLDFTYEGTHFTKGPIQLNGTNALRFSRMRYDDPRGDWGRQLRQRSIIEAVIKKGADISSITKFGDLFKVVQDNVKTNLTFDNMWDIQENYKDARGHIEQHQINGKGVKIDKIYYLEVPDKERLAIIDSLRNNLDLPANTASTN
ncbi:LytR family transcriptional regulator [Metabacillus sp. GX 13764]|uniref:polyisoprenyl-teichoic acid--peptidoglycan teichoic acid transferase TagU n=1 Tax=Metabacillus kandeliae TaxID=2900151 RepID=UPI001E63C90A|nr:LytR family transcriptional regulator [Metabacillus kandeliae]